MLQQPNNKKIRGLRKKCCAMVNALTEQTSHFPEKCLSEEYWHVHLPVDQSFVDSRQIPKSVKKLCMQTMLDRACFLAAHKDSTEYGRVLCLISLPDLWASEIIIFYSHSYYESFFNRNTVWQKLIPLGNQAIVKEYNLHIPYNFQVKGYKHECFDEDNTNILTYSGEIWAIGELA